MLLKEKADKDIHQHHAEMKELIRIIEHDQKLKEFMSVKGQERHEDIELIMWKQRKGAYWTTFGHSRGQTFLSFLSF